MKHLKLSAPLTIGLLSLLLSVVSQSCKHEPLYPDKSSDTTVWTQNPPPPTTQDGTTLYNTYCASCHGPLTTSAKAGATATQIQNGINSVSNMKSLSVLSSAQVQAIADALKQTSSQPPVLDGATLYANNCAGCHGVLASSTKAGATLAQIQHGIATVNDMKTLSSLSTEQLQAIVSVLANITPPTPSLDGSTLYANYCASCHNSLNSSTKGGATASQIQNAIANISNMKSLSTLTSAQIQAIAGVLANVNPPAPSTDGATLYANYCASCHGVLASSTKIGASTTRIQNAISSVSNMSSLSSLSTTQIKAISDALIAQPMPTDGPSLYAINCVSCHGALASSQVGSSSVSRIKNAISEKRAMNYLSFLTDAQIKAISDALAGIQGGDD